MYTNPELERQKHTLAWAEKLDAVFEFATAATDVTFTFVILAASGSALYEWSCAVLATQLALRLVMALLPLTYTDLQDLDLLVYAKGVAITLADPLYGVKVLHDANKDKDKLATSKVAAERQLQYSLLYAGVLMLAFEDVPELGRFPPFPRTCFQHDAMTINGTRVSPKVVRAARRGARSSCYMCC